MLGFNLSSLQQNDEIKFWNLFLGEIPRHYSYLVWKINEFDILKKKKNPKNILKNQKKLYQTKELFQNFGTKKFNSDDTIDVKIIHRIYLFIYLFISIII